MSNYEQLLSDEGKKKEAERKSAREIEQKKKTGKLPVLAEF